MCFFVCWKLNNRTVLWWHINGDVNIDKSKKKKIKKKCTKNNNIAFPCISSDSRSGDQGLCISTGCYTSLYFLQLQRFSSRTLWHTAKLGTLRHFLRAVSHLLCGCVCVCLYIRQTYVSRCIYGYDQTGSIERSWALFSMHCYGSYVSLTPQSWQGHIAQYMKYVEDSEHHCHLQGSYFITCKRTCVWMRLSVCVSV